MKTILSLLIFPLFLFNSGEFTSHQNKIQTEFTHDVFDRCNEWASTKEYRNLYIKICEYDSGSSGYFQFKNNYNKAVRFSYKIFHNNGDVTKGSTNIKSGETRRTSCYNCAEKNGGGNKSYELYKVYFQGEKGYW